MNLMDQLDEEYAARYRADQRTDQFAAALRSRGCPEECIPTFLADREAENSLTEQLAVMQRNYGQWHPCCTDECLEIVPPGTLFCDGCHARMEAQRRKARSRSRRLFRWHMEGM